AMIDSRARLRRSSSDHCDEATPTIGTLGGRVPYRTIWYTPGNSFFFARSPVMPNRTRASPLGLPSSAVRSTEFGLPHRGRGSLGCRSHFFDHFGVMGKAREEHLVRARRNGHSCGQERVERPRVSGLVGRPGGCV